MIVVMYELLHLIMIIVGVMMNMCQSLAISCYVLFLWLSLFI